MLLPQYTFNTFVIGPSNQFAHAVAEIVSETPGTAYNPLLIYGKDGTGKTHLMHAIGNKIMERHPEMNVLYLSAEGLTNELITAIRYNRVKKLRERFNTANVLFIDDIQYLAGKSYTQEELFNILSYLYERQRQIVITCNRSPLEIADIKGRIISRFSMALMADIQPPDIKEDKRVVS